MKIKNDFHLFLELDTESLNGKQIQLDLLYFNWSFYIEIEATALKYIFNFLLFHPIHKATNL